MKYRGVFLLTLVAILVAQTKADACLAMDDMLDDGSFIDCNDFYNGRISYDLWNIFCCEEADEVPRFNMSSSTMPCECV
ncbi:hypothetical protein PoB_001827300 [Plakobranchus ocellatus]|uniref:Thyroglobulin type-1 domain-containing protein n=1 Tax=Plakobranchus ocellatus TaxID=259542 RepID=A0AAV3ZAZ0_9GAST|nr:hypothetical protein PoB_001827300 [Plakobranchus ocellatus]